MERFDDQRKLTLRERRITGILEWEAHMRSIVISLAASSLLGALVIAQAPTSSENNSRRSRYIVTDLGNVGGSPGGLHFIANNGLASGAATVPNGSMHAFLWFNGLKLDIGAPGLGGAHSAAFGVNEVGQAVGEAETSVPDDEDFCGFNALGLLPTATRCRPFLWQHGAMKDFRRWGAPTASRAQSTIAASWPGMRRIRCGTRTRPAQCSSSSPSSGKMAGFRKSTLGEPDGVAAAINDHGQVVGASGTCAPSTRIQELYLVENHALLWERGMVTDLGNLGGTGGIAGNHACAINNQGQVVGHSELPNNTTFHGFLWTRETGMRDLDTLPGDVASLALGINDKGEVVGASLDAKFSPRAVLWEGDAMTDLNTLIPANSGLHLLLAVSISAGGEIVGLAVTNTGALHGFLATPKHAKDDH